MRTRVVVELGSGNATAYCGRLLSLLGADVIKVEPAEGDVFRTRGPSLASAPGHRPESASFAYANAGKRSFAVNTGATEGRNALQRLVSTASAVIYAADDRAIPFDDVTAAASRDAAVTCISHFGQTGAHAGFQGSDFTDWAAGGYTFITGYERGSPRVGGGAWCAYAAGVFGAFMTLSAWLHQMRSAGSGPTIFDLSIQDVMVSLHQWTFSLYTHQGVVKRRSGNRHAESYHPMGFLPCKDGWLCIGVASIEQWERFCIAIDMPELLLDARFESGAGRFDNAAAFDDLVGPWFRSRRRAEAVEHLQKHDVPASPVHTIAETLADDQLRHRRFFSSLRIGDREGLAPRWPFPLAEPPPKVLSAPAIGEHTTEVLLELGYGEPEIARLVLAGAVVDGIGTAAAAAGAQPSNG